MRYPIPTICKQHSCSCTSLSSSPSVLVWLHGPAKQIPSFQGQLVCGAGKPCQQGSSASQIAHKMRCKASTTEVLVESPVRSDHVKVRYCTVQVPRVGRSHSRPHTPSCPAARTRGEGYPSPHFQFLLLFPSKIHINCFPFPFCSRLSHLPSQILKPQRRNQYVLLLRPQQPIFLLACSKSHCCRLISA